MRTTNWAAICALALCSQPAAAEPLAPTSDAARQLIQVCLAEPSQQLISEQAAALAATPLSLSGAQEELGQSHATTTPSPATPGHALRTETSTTALRAWRVAGSPPALLTYREGQMRQVEITLPDDKPVGPMQSFKTRQCDVNFQQTNAKEVFTSFEALQDLPYGALILPDGRTVMFFTFQQYKLDIELTIQLDAPLPGITPNESAGVPTRILLADGGPQFMNGAPPGMPVVSLTRAALLSALDRSATVHLIDVRFDPPTAQPNH
jgi:hypothetical protein